MAGYIDTTVQELAECNSKLKDVRNVIDAIIADYDEVPGLKKLINKYEMYGINEYLTRAQTALELIVTDAKKAREKRG